MPDTSHHDLLLSLLRKYWGYDSFRTLQEEIMESVLSGNDTLGLMPTGGGKSITFQVPGLALDGLTIVVTPLISLMKDQIDNLKRHHIKAVCFHSGMSAPENRIAWEKLTNGRAKFLYIAPERLRNERFLAEMRNLPIRLIVVDEAHCISQWGYDFRPSYLEITKLRKIKPKVPVLALTATATPEVAKDICRQLGFREGHRVFRMGFTRENISYIVRRTEEKYTEILHILTRTTGSAIVYVRSRKRTREIAEFLSSAGLPATFYHAGLDYTLKAERQNSWQKGEVRIMVATNAFGMGIDKPDVRTVIHFDMPPSLEEYYQEAGRAGRDGLPSFAVLLVGKNDKATLRKHLTEAFPTRENIRKIYEQVCNFINISLYEGYNSLKEFDINKFCETFSAQERNVRACLNLLGQAGYLSFIEETESSSRVLITSEREELYYLRGVTEEAEQVIAMLLRSYPGLFADYIYINEARMARDSGLSEQQVYESLIELSKKRVLSYIPRRRTPYIHVETSREEPKYVKIPRSVYEERMEIMKHRVESMISYAYMDDSCRVRPMLAYFGDETDDCGKCDVCRERKKRAIPQKEARKKQEQLAADILNYLASTGATGASCRQISFRLNSNAEETASVLKYFAEQGYLRVENDRYILRNNN